MVELLLQSGANVTATHKVKEWLMDNAERDASGCWMFYEIALNILMVILT